MDGNFLQRLREQLKFVKANFYVKTVRISVFAEAIEARILLLVPQEYC